MSLIVLKKKHKHGIPRTDMLSIPTLMKIRQLIQKPLAGHARMRTHGRNATIGLVSPTSKGKYTLANCVCTPFEYTVLLLSFLHFFHGMSCILNIIV